MLSVLLLPEDLHVEFKIPSEVQLTDVKHPTCHSIMKIGTLGCCYMGKTQHQQDIKEKLLNVATQTSDSVMFILLQDHLENIKVWMLIGTADQLFQSVLSDISSIILL